MLAQALLTPKCGLCIPRKCFIIQQLVLCRPVEAAGGCCLASIQAIVSDPRLAFKFSRAMDYAAQLHEHVRAPCWVPGAQDGCHQAVALHPHRDVRNGGGSAGKPQCQPLYCPVGRRLSRPRLLEELGHLHKI